jgi:hypothetical protein
MPQLTLNATSRADRLLLAGLFLLQPVLDELGDGVLLIGGLAVAAWLHASPGGLPVRATRDVDLGIDRRALGLTTSRRRIRPLLMRHGFAQRPGDEPFRFVRQTKEGPFSLDLLLPKGASRRDPPLIEAGLDSVAAPGLAYALDRGADRLDLTLVADERTRELRLPIATLDAMLVMKAALASAGVRMQQDRRVADTVDAVMLTAACAEDPVTLRALRRHRRRSEPSRALKWLAGAFNATNTREVRRVERHFRDEYDRPDGATWAVGTVARFLEALDAANEPG